MSYIVRMPKLGVEMEVGEVVEWHVSVGDAVEEIADRGLTVLLIEQNVHEALRVADRGYVLDQGDIVYQGATEELENEDLDEYLVV